jgi:CYTH domain-containing protein/CHAD domain-containing protein
MAHEIERKFLLGKLPSLAEATESIRIQQGYLAIDERAEVRVRRAGNETLLAVKAGHGEMREEVEINVGERQYEALWPLTEGRRLLKTRHLIPLEGGLQVELDVFEGSLEGLAVAEIEFADVRQSREFEPPAWLGEEVTCDQRYSGQSLAVAGAPPRRGARRSSGPQRGGASRAYRLERKEGPAEGATRIAAGRAEKAIEELACLDRGEPSAAAVHAARKDMKKLRALLRLVRAEIGEERFRKENERYRDVGRRLAESRDAEVKIETLAALRERFGGELPVASLAAWRAELEAERDAVGGGGELVSRVAIAEIEVGRDEISRWDLSSDSWDLLAPGLRRSYRRGLREMKRVREKRRADDVHSWRKRVKDLWYQLRLVRGAWPEVVGETAEQAHELADLLGDHHDLTLLAEDLAGRERLAARASLSAAIERRQEALLDAALDLGRRIYAEKPKAFMRRMALYWDAWRSA